MIEIPPLFLTTPAVLWVMGFSCFYSDSFFGRMAAEKDGCYLCQLQEEGSIKTS